MRTTKLRLILACTAACAATAIGTMGVMPSPVVAQPGAWSADLGLVGMTSYPTHLEAGCAGGRGLAPSARAHYRPHRLLSLEAGASYQLTVGGTRIDDCGRVVEREAGGGGIGRNHDATRGNASLSTEGRIVLTPTGDRPSTFRVIGGGFLYPGEAVRGWLVGGGIHIGSAWGGVVVDLERWRVGTPYTDVMVTWDGVGEGHGEVWGEGTDWDSHWQVRVAFLLWSP